MIARGLLGGIINTVKFNNSLSVDDPHYLDWVAASQGTTTFDVASGGSAIEGGVRVLDFGLPAYQFSAFAHVALVGAGEEDLLEVDISPLLAAYGLNGIQAAGTLAIGHARLMNDGDDVPGQFHVVVSASSGKLAFMDSSGALFTTAIVDPTGAVDMMVEFQALND